MPRKRSIIAPASMAEILRQAGAERVGEDAAKAFSELIMDKAMDMAKDAVRFAMHAGRKTVKRSDIDIVRKNSE